MVIGPGNPIICDKFVLFIALSHLAKFHLASHLALGRFFFVPIATARDGVFAKCSSAQGMSS